MPSSKSEVNFHCYIRVDKSFGCEDMDIEHKNISISADIGGGKRGLILSIK